MSLAPSALPRQDETDHRFDHVVTFKGGQRLYVSSIPTRDRHVQEYDVPIYAVSFASTLPGESDSAREETTHLLSRFLNMRTPRFRRDVMGNSRHYGAHSLRYYIDAGVIFAHKPVYGEPLELCFVPVPAFHDSMVKVHRLGTIKSFGVIRTIIL